MSRKPTKIFARALSALNTAEGLRNGLADALKIFHQAELLMKGFVAVYEETSDSWQIIVAEGFTVAEFHRLESNLEKIITRRFPNLSEAESDSIFEIRHENPADGRQEFVGKLLSNQEKVNGLVCIDALSADNDFLEFLQALCQREFRVENVFEREKAQMESVKETRRQEAKEKYDFGNLIGNSSPMKAVYDRVSQMARSNSTVLLRGEAGTGKQRLANTIHYNSLRAKQNFSKISLAALPENRAEAELFGSENKKGLLEETEGGTLYFDEIGASSPELQSKINRLIHEKRFERNGKTVRCNVRYIFSTAHDLEKAVSDGAFSADLFETLSAFTIFIPPLRERKADILLLAEHFLEKYELIYEKRIRRISTAAIDMLTAYHFPGNVRELENVVERAVNVCDSNVLHGHHLPPTLQTAEVSGTLTDVSLDAAVENFERALIIDALKTTRGNRAQAAKMLSTTERIINYKIKKYAINPLRFR